MPIVIYIFSLCAFALGLTEFLVIGLVSAISNDLGSPIESVGTTVTAYAIGATIGAPFLTALTTNWPRKTVMVVTMLVFSLGSLAATLSSSVHAMLISRFIAGLAHGVFLAVAASVATQIVADEKKGSAVAYVFAGLTLALAFGVPIGTYLGSIISWRMSFLSVTVCGFIGLLGILFLMPKIEQENNLSSQHAIKSVLHIFNPILLFGALITVLGYAGAFTLYTYITPLLEHITKANIKTISYFMIIYGVFAALGNIIGGKLTDRLGVNYMVALIMALFTVDLFFISIYGDSLYLMVVLIALLGAVSYAAVPAMQARVISLANLYVPNAVPVASGLNIAGFNSGIALGSLFGGAIVSTIGIEYLAIIGALITLVGLLIMMIPMPRNSTTTD